jgi:hypothetical protein
MCEDKRKIIGKSGLGEMPTLAHIPCHAHEWLVLAGLAAYLWYAIALLSIAYVCSAIAVAARNNVATTGNKAAGFAAIWSMLILFLIIIGGTLTMKRVRPHMLLPLCVLADQPCQHLSFRPSYPS